ncbi:MAG: hypothetical protein ACQCN3_11625 [Candidatus Bathyarchaeia archaeon]
MKVKCVSCTNKFDVYPEIFDNYEIVFCPFCGLDHQVIKSKQRQAQVKALQIA